MVLILLVHNKSEKREATREARRADPSNERRAHGSFGLISSLTGNACPRYFELRFISSNYALFARSDGGRL